MTQVGPIFLTVDSCILNLSFVDESSCLQAFNLVSVLGAPDENTFFAGCCF